MRPACQILAIAVLGALAAPPAQAAPARVDVDDFFYRAYRVKVNPGEAVTWRILDGSPHTITSNRGSPAAFDSGEKDPGATYSFTFATPGRYKYFCLIHPGLMDGVVQVGPDTTVPKVSRVKAKRGKRSVRLSFRLNEDAKAKVTVIRAGRVVKTIRTKSLRDGGRSVLYKPKSLRPGRYRMKLEVTDLEGNAAKAVSKRFTVPRPRSS